MPKKRPSPKRRSADEKAPESPAASRRAKVSSLIMASGIWEGDLRAMRKDRVLTKRPDTN